jgi:hypothetical protein
MIQFQTTGFDAGIAINGNLNHFVTKLGIENVAKFVWRVAGGNKQDLVQAKHATNCAGNVQMALCHRVKGTAEDSDVFHSFCPVVFFLVDKEKNCG